MKVKTDGVYTLNILTLLAQSRDPPSRLPKTFLTPARAEVFDELKAWCARNDFYTKPGRT